MVRNLTDLERPEVLKLYNDLKDFVEDLVIPAEAEFEEEMSRLSGLDRFQHVPKVLEDLKNEAKKRGFWNLFLTHHTLPPHLADLEPSIKLTLREYGIMCELLGSSFLASEACNCSAPDTGNMEVMIHFASELQQKKFNLRGLLDGSIRSAFCMTEPDVASSDATNIQCSLEKSNNNEKSFYRLNGRKWWITGAMDPRCEFVLVLCRNSNNTQKQRVSHRDHTVVIVPREKVKIIRAMTVFGEDHAPNGHAELVFEDVSVPEEDILLGIGRGFEIAQSRLGPGRVHHCMRAIGLASRCYEFMLHRVLDRSTFGKKLYQHGMCQDLISNSRTDLEMARLLTLSCAQAIDDMGAEKARDKIAMIKVAVPQLTLAVVDRAIQVFGGAGVSQDFPIAKAFTGLRCLRIADGPDAVHKRTLALIEVKKKVRELKQATVPKSRI